MDNNQLTIFTPTFNRSEHLKKLYDSLLSQSDKRFVWLIVDDGSTDNTTELVKAWKSENKIPIEYIYQENHGKHVAHNTGVMNTHTACFYCVDSDDYLPLNAAENIYKELDDIIKRPDIAGLIAKKGFNNGPDMCTRFPDNISEVSIRDIYLVYKLKGELALVFKTEVLREFLFPVFGDEKFVTESVILDLLSIKYKMKLLNKVIYLGEYLPDGYTNNLTKVHRNNPVGYHYYLVQGIKLAKTLKEARHAYAVYIVGCWKIGHKVELDYKNFYANLPEAIALYMKLVIKNAITKSKFLLSLYKRVKKYG